MKMRSDKRKPPWCDETEISESMKQVNSSSRGSITMSPAPQQQLGLTCDRIESIKVF